MPKRQYRSAPLLVLATGVFALPLIAQSAENDRGLAARSSVGSRIILAQRKVDETGRRKPRDNRGGDRTKRRSPNRAVSGGRRPVTRARRGKVNERRAQPTERRRPSARPTRRTQEPRWPNTRPTDRAQERLRRIRERQAREQRERVRQRRRPSGETREADRDRAGPRRNGGGTRQRQKWQERLTRWRERRGRGKRRRFGGRDVTVIKKGNAIAVRRRRLHRNSGKSRFIESRRYRVRNKRFRNRFRNGISIYARPPRGIGLDPKWYIVDSSRGSYQVYLDTFLAPPLYTIDRAYTLDEIVQDPEIRSYVRSVSLNTLHFELGSAEIADQELKKLEDMARAMLEVLDRRPKYVFLLEGHTDATGSPETNLKLSEERAASVQIVLVEEYGVPAENLKAVGYGEQYLEVETEEAEERNRRVVVRGIGTLLTGRR